MNHGLLIASGGLWGLVYSTLTLAIVNTGGPLKAGTWVDTMFLTAGLGAGAMALATLKYNPTSTQILRADIFGLGVGAAVFAISELVLGLNFNQATPYVLGMVSSAGAIAAVSLLWEEAAERHDDKLANSGCLVGAKFHDACPQRRALARSHSMQMGCSGRAQPPPATNERQRIEPGARS